VLKPIACTLSPVEMSDRASFIERLVADALLGRDEIDGGVRGRFRDTPDVERRVRELVAAESDCCTFLSFAVAHRQGELWLDVTGEPDVARRMFDLP
jgi:hypothetical protein